MKEEQFNWLEFIYRDKLGREIECDELEILLRHPDYKVVQKDRVGQYVISTVWLGVPFGAKGDQYFETLVFDENNPEGDRIIDCHRYKNLKQAEEGHMEILKDYSY